MVNDFVLVFLVERLVCCRVHSLGVARNYGLFGGEAWMD